MNRHTIVLLVSIAATAMSNVSLFPRHTMVQDGVETGISLPLSPHYNEASDGTYFVNMMKYMDNFNIEDPESSLSQKDIARFTQIYERFNYILDGKSAGDNDAHFVQEMFAAFIANDSSVSEHQDRLFAIIETWLNDDQAASSAETGAAAATTGTVLEFIKSVSPSSPSSSPTSDDQKSN